MESYLDLLQDKLEQQIEDGEWNDYKDCPSKMADRLDYIFNGCIDFRKALGITQIYNVWVSFEVDAENAESAIDKISNDREFALRKAKQVKITIC